jgi:hypothetical protein
MPFAILLRLGKIVDETQQSALDQEGEQGKINRGQELNNMTKSRIET